MIQNSNFKNFLKILEKHFLKNMFLLLIIDFLNYMNANQFNKF